MTRTSLMLVATLAPMLAAPATASAAWETANVGGVDARIYTPSTVSKIGEGHGLLVVLHGCSQNADALRDYGNFEPAAEEFGWIVAIPNVPNGGVVAGCWDYYGAVHTRASGHNAAIIGLAETLRDDAARDVDPAQIYLAGFSSGGGQALVTGCLAPELFGGVGVVAGPSLGTSIAQIASVGTTAAQAASVCTQLAANAADLETQLAIAYTDTNDLVVAQGYAMVNAEMYGQIVGEGLSAMSEQSLDVGGLEGAAPSGVGTVWSDATADRVMWLQTDGNGHNWPAGSGEAVGGGLTFVSSSGVNFSYLMAEFFTANNLRADGQWTPGDSGMDPTGGQETDGGGASTSGDSGSDPEGTTGAGSGAEPGDGTDGSTGQVDTDTAGADDVAEPAGCQCRARPDGGGPAPGAILALGLLLVQRNRRSRNRSRPANH